LATYSYNLRDQIAATVVESGLFTAARSYDTAGRLTGVGNGSLDSTAYTLSADGRRTAATRNGTTDTYGYDAARQVTSASLPTTSGTQSKSYAYDPAGNRSSASTNGVTATYLANSVNEYTAITGTPAPPMYDPNGNAISYPVRPVGSASTLNGIFTWDINNQQITASVGTDSATYQYDALGRRTKRTETIAGLTTSTYFLTNGWNVELEHNGSTYTTRQTWCLDLSKSLQGAGGVGGLVMMETLPAGGGAPTPSFPTYDGNGNITAWVNVSGSIIARQRYDAFGNIVDQTGTAPSNYGFSTKPQEKITGFHYYGYRYYDPFSGRWPSRDPIEEKGGINLYGMVENDAVNQWDLLGRITMTNNCPSPKVPDPEEVQKCLDIYNEKLEIANSNLKIQGVAIAAGATFCAIKCLKSPLSAITCVVACDAAAASALAAAIATYDNNVAGFKNDLQRCIDKAPCVCP
jgi:RHS repeat-associated protein